MQNGKGNIDITETGSKCDLNWRLIQQPAPGAVDCDWYNIMTGGLK
jgi:hypothetical protein